MKLLISSKQAALLAIVSMTTVAASMSTASAMPGTAQGSGIVSGGTSTLVQKTGWDQHRVYSGSDSASAKQARAAKPSINQYCDKHENDCQ